MKRIYTGMVFVIFAGYILYLGITTKVWTAKLIFLIIGSVVLFISAYYEYLKWLYLQMIQALTVETNLEKAQTFRSKLIAKDWMGGFKHSILLFDSLLLMDQGNYQACLQHMEQHRKFFHSTIDYLFITYHNQLLCYYFLQRPERAEEVYRKLMEIKHLNKKQYRPLFSWDEIAGIHYAIGKRHQKSLHAFEQVPIQQLNTREKAYLYYLIAEQYKALNQLQDYGKALKQSREFGQTLTITRRNPNEAFQ